MINEFSRGTRRYCFKKEEHDDPKRIGDLEVVQDMPKLPSDEDSNGLSLPLIISVASLALVTTLFTSVFMAYAYVEQRFCFAPSRKFREFKFSNSLLAPGKRITLRMNRGSSGSRSSQNRTTWRSRPLKSFQELEQSCMETTDRRDDSEISEKEQISNSTRNAFVSANNPRLLFNSVQKTSSLFNQRDLRKKEFPESSSSSSATHLWRSKQLRRGGGGGGGALLSSEAQDPSEREVPTKTTGFKGPKLPPPNLPLLKPSRNNQVNTGNLISLNSVVFMVCNRELDHGIRM